MVDIKINNVLTQDRRREHREDLLDLLEEATPPHRNANTISIKKSMIMVMSNTTMDMVRVKVRIMVPRLI